jgi:cation:H+ antiporter
MTAITEFITSGPAIIAWVVMVISFAILAKAADFFVDAAVAIAERLKIPKVIIGIVLVSLATTAPELCVSVMSAVRGNPEMALGNAIGSVICNCGLALALCGALSAAPIAVMTGVLKVSGSFLLGSALLTFAFVCTDLSLERWEGLTLLAVFCVYLGVLFRQHRSGKLRQNMDLDTLEEDVAKPMSWLLPVFLLALGGILLSSRFVVISAVTIARTMSVPESVIALTLVALGTSIPEVATSIIAARKGHGDLSIGNILGANMMNICWVAGASSVVNSLTLGAREIFFMFPAMFVILGVTLVVLKLRSEFSRRDGILLFALYIIYLASFLFVFRPTG